jgi:hypothetical protein
MCRRILWIEQRLLYFHVELRSMRLVLLCSVSAVLGLAATHVVETPATQPTEVTVILDFKGAYSDQSLDEMKREVASIMKGSGYVFDWRLRNDAAASSFSNLIVVTLTGECLMDPAREIPNESGPLALAHTSGSNVLRFADVHCNAVSHLVSLAAAAGGYDDRNVLFGRGLGRVLAHELCHILGNTLAHSEDGVFKSTLSGRQLVSRRFEIDPADLDRLRFRHARLEY